MIIADLTRVFSPKGRTTENLDNYYVGNGYEAGIYVIDGENVFGNGQEWGCLILIPVYGTQIIITTQTVRCRNHTGASGNVKWNSWKILV